jgi:hypothetical protein
MLIIAALFMAGVLMGEWIVFSVRYERGIRLTITRGDWRLENSTGVLWRSR